MSDQIIYECQAFAPSLKRAQRHVPPEFLPCYEWFQSHAGEKISRLPHRMETKPPTPIPLSRDSGIYVPGKTRVSFPHGRSYALSVHSSEKSPYSDRKPLPLADGTWVLDYAAHEGSDSTQNYNRALMNCLADGVPVGVMLEEHPGYRILGLAFVERYNSATKMFSLHGPVSEDTEAAGSFSLPGFDELPPAERRELAALDTDDERKIVMTESVRREQQGKFRSLLLEAYQETCAISDVNVPEVLQAAHINPYRGKKSQTVNNGILLRADLHLLYDAHLMSVEPETLAIRLSDQLAHTKYLQYHMTALREPEDPHLAPSRDLLALHYEQFRQESRLLTT